MDPSSLPAIALAVAQEHSVDVVLSRIVEQLSQESGIALVRVWLLDRGDICDTCRLRAQCPGYTSCLHLVASAGASQATPLADWSRLDGDFRRFPLGVRKVGHIGASGEGILVHDLEQQPQWIARPEWARSEGIRAFAGQPLIFRQQILGVLGVFSRQSIDAAAFAWLRTFADHAAVAISNSRAFAEIDRLRQRLELENEALRDEVRRDLAGGEMVGSSDALARVLEQIELVAPTDASVLILGESGVGKELVVRRLHERSARRQQPLIKVNCAAIPHELFESEFFGHMKGSFTGALRDRGGRFEAADGGTLFLDEVGEIPLDLQSKLLRVLQEGEFERVGEERTRHVDVRVIAATNRDLVREIEAGHFRRDLYYRLSIFPLAVPPLRERRDDIAALAEHFVRLSARRLGVAEPSLDAEQLERLRAYDWPGNIRELHNVIERAVIMSRGNKLRVDLAPVDVAALAAAKSATAAPSPAVVLPEAERRRRERDNIETALCASGGKIYGTDGAANLLGIRPTTLASRMKALGISRLRQSS